MIEILRARRSEQAFYVGRDRHQSRQPEAISVFPEVRSDLRAVHAGQVEVQQGDVVLVLAQGFQGLDSVSDGIDLMAALVQKQFQQILGNRAVFRDQHLTPLDRVGLRLQRGRRLVRVEGAGKRHRGYAKQGFVLGRKLPEKAQFVVNASHTELYFGGGVGIRRTPGPLFLRKEVMLVSGSTKPLADLLESAG